MSFNRSRWAALGAAVAVSAGAGGLGLVHAASDSSASSFVSMVPCRMLDTRTDASIDTIGAGESVTLTGRGVVGDCSIPTEATGLSINIAAVRSTADTFLTVFPSGAARPNASHLNVKRGTTVSNGVDVTLSADGRLDVFNDSGTVNVIIDVLGAYVPAATGGGAAGAQGAAGAAGDVGPRGETGLQGPAGIDGNKAFRKVPVELELVNRYSYNNQYTNFGYNGPLDVCGDDMLMDVELLGDFGDLYNVRSSIYSSSAGQRNYFPFGFGNNGAGLTNDSVTIELNNQPYSLDPTTVVKANVLCGAAPTVDGTFDGVPDNDVTNDR